MAQRKTDELPIKDILESYKKDGSKVSFAGLSEERKKYLYDKLYNDCSKLLGSRTISLLGQINKFKRHFIDTVQQGSVPQETFKKVMNFAYNIDVEFPDSDADKEMRKNFKKRFKGFKMPENGEYPENLDEAISGLLELYGELKSMVDHYKMINKAVIDDKIKAEKQLAKYYMERDKLDPEFDDEIIKLIYDECNYGEAIRLLDVELKKIRKREKEIPIVPDKDLETEKTEIAQFNPEETKDITEEEVINAINGADNSTDTAISDSVNPANPISSGNPDVNTVNSSNHDDVNSDDGNSGNGGNPDDDNPDFTAEGGFTLESGDEYSADAGDIYINNDTIGDDNPDKEANNDTDEQIDETVVKPVGEMSDEELALHKAELIKMLAVYDNSASLLEETTPDKLREKGKQLTQAGYQERELIRERVGRIDPYYIRRVRTALASGNDAEIAKIVNSSVPVIDPLGDREMKNYYQFSSSAMQTVENSLQENGIDINQMYTNAVVNDSESKGEKTSVKVLNEGMFGNFINKFTMEAAPTNTNPENDFVNAEPGVEEPSSDGGVYSPSKNTRRKKKEGVIKRLGKWIARRPVWAGTLLFAGAALPLVGALALNALPAVFVWGGVGLLAGNVVKGIAKMVSPRYRRFLVNYDIQKQRRKIEATQERSRQTMMEVENILNSRTKSPEDRHQYVNPGKARSSEAAAEAIGYFNGKKSRKRKKLDKALKQLGKAEKKLKIRRSDMDLTGLDEKQIKEIVRLGTKLKKSLKTEKKLKKRIDRKYEKIGRIDVKIGDSDLVNQDGIAQSQVKNSKTFKTEEEIKMAEEAKGMAVPRIMNTGLGRWLDSKHHKFRRMNKRYNKRADNVETRLADVVTEAIDGGNKRDALDFIVRDALANGGEVNSNLMNIVQSKFGDAGVSYVEAKIAETTMGGDTTASETIYNEVDMENVLNSDVESKKTPETIKNESDKAVIVLNVKLYYQSGKSFEEFRADYKSLYGDRFTPEMEKAAEEAFNRLKAAERIRPARPTGGPKPEGSRRPHDINEDVM